MKNKKKFFFSKEEKVLDLLNNLNRNQMSTIVGAYSEIPRTYAESTGVKKVKVDPRFKNKNSMEATLVSGPELKLRPNFITVE